LIADACLEGASAFENRLRQSQPSANKSESATAEGAHAAGSEGGVRKQLRNIPTEIDYRLSDEETPEEAAAAEAPAEEGAVVGETDEKKK
jgi:hypothetical protein